MTRREKVPYVVIVAAWILLLSGIGVARRIIADEYLHALPPHVTAVNLPVSTSYVALPILAGDRTQHIAKTPFVIYWLVLFAWPMAVLTWMWRAEDRYVALARWIVGVSAYAVFVLGSAMMIAFSLWLPMRT
jgi:hypothetical protein